ncbi:MAG: hypothetical protein ACYC26_04570 [Phycisphaerales bacterium]
MSSYKGQNLFGSGAHHFVVQGVTVRHDEHVSPGADGAAITMLGRDPRKIEQRGMLLADDVAGLEAQLRRFADATGGVPGTLVDELGRSHERMVLVEFKQSRVTRIGARLGINYVAQYVQAGEP